MTIWLIAWAITITWTPNQAPEPVADPAVTRVEAPEPAPAPTRAEEPAPAEAGPLEANAAGAQGRAEVPERAQLPAEIPPPYDVALLVRPGSDARQLAALFGFWTRRLEPARFPRIVAQEPGPIALDNGLRILPNEFLPAAKPPKLLILDFDSRQKMGNLLLAFARRTLSEGGQVWLIGDTIPEGLRAQDLSAGQRPQLINGAELEALLLELPIQGQ